MTKARGFSKKVVGIGSSAGGINALKHVLRKLPQDFPVSILVVQHLAPNHESRLPEILDRNTELKVVMAAEDGLIREGWVYVAPPNRHLVLGPGDGFHLIDTGQVRYSRPSVDVLLEAIAEAAGASAIAVILSGTGSDGADGARAVSEAGGLVIVQDPKTAAHPPMPAAALRSAPEALVVPLEEIGAKLIELTEDRR